MTLSDLTYYAFLFKNDLHHVHLHASGEDFDKIHAISQSLYEELDSEIDELAELAISNGCSVDCFSNVKSFVDESQWEPEKEEAYNWEAFMKVLSEKGRKYLDSINDCEEKDDRAVTNYLDDIYSFWDKEVNYKTAARGITSGDTYIDAMVDVEDGEEGAINYDKDGEDLESMNTDLIITSGVRIDPLADTPFGTDSSDDDSESDSDSSEDSETEGQDSEDTELEENEEDTDKEKSEEED